MCNRLCLCQVLLQIHHPRSWECGEFSGNEERSAGLPARRTEPWARGTRNPPATLHWERSPPRSCPTAWCLFDDSARASSEHMRVLLFKLQTINHVRARSAPKSSTSRQTFLKAVYERSSCQNPSTSRAQPEAMDQQLSSDKGRNQIRNKAWVQVCVQSFETGLQM